MEHLILVKILPSLLAADLMHLGQEIDKLSVAGANLLHLDIMDQHYVPNISFGVDLCTAIHQYNPNIPIDVHLMVDQVDASIQQFAQAGAIRITIHHDATLHLDRSLMLIKNLNCQAGLALNPATSPEIIHYCMHRLDFILIMTVNPGFSGQDFIPEMLDKIHFVHQNYPSLPICVDGGININNIASLANAGATQFILGAGLFNTEDYANTIKTMLDAIK